MKELKKEIRKVLCGIIEDDGNCVKAAEGFLNRTYASGGTLQARLFGVVGVSALIETGARQKLKLCADVLSEEGRRLELKNAPEGRAVLARSLVTNSFVLLAEESEKGVKLSFFSARNIYARIRGKAVLKRIQKKLLLNPEFAGSKEWKKAKNK